MVEGKKTYHLTIWPETIAETGSECVLGCVRDVLGCVRVC
jgi:hypothetical protein